MINHLSRIVALALLAVAISPLVPRAMAADGDWFQFRGPAGDGHSLARGLPVEFSETKNVRWKTAIHGRGWSSPVVWDRQIWLTTATEDGVKMSALCLDAESGQILRDVLLFEPAKRSEIHKLNSYASCTPVIEKGRVYVHFGSYGTACLDTQNGDVVWKRDDLPCEHWRGPGSSPILDGNRLIIHYDGYDYQYIVALDKATGETIWKRDRGVQYGTDNGDIMKAFSTPLVITAAGRRQLISTTSKAVLSYDPESGEEIWRVRYNEFSATARPLFGHGLLFINTGFGKAELWAIRPDGKGDVTDSHVVWRYAKSIGSKPSQLLIDGLIYSVHDAGVATCLDAMSGEEVWVERLDGEYSASPIYGDGKIYFLNQDGKVTVAAPGRTYQELAANQLESGVMASPGVVDNGLLIRTTSHLYRIEQ